MNETLNKIHEYLLEKGVDEKTIKGWDTSSVYLAMEIAEYAHRNQKRENGEDYANHPFRCLDIYRQWVGIKPHDFNSVDTDLLYEYDIPYDGVQEVCLLHDVIEDTEFDMNDLREIFKECGFAKYFELYIERPLEKITHDKTVDYKDYIAECACNPTSALVKMIDMQDNLRIMDLALFDSNRYSRAQDYLFYIYAINDIYHFIENMKKYREALKEE